MGAGREDGGINTVCMFVLAAQLGSNLCDSMDCSPAGSSVHGVLQARILLLSFPSPEHLPNPVIEPRSPALQAFSLPSELPGKPRIDTRADEILDRNEKNIILVPLSCQRGVWAPYR